MKIINKIKTNKNLRCMAMTVFCMVLMTTSVFATEPEGVTQFNSMITFLATWLGRVGGVVAFLGAVQFIISIKSGNPESKTNGVMFFIVGLMLIGVCSDAALTTLGLISSGQA